MCKMEKREFRIIGIKNKGSFMDFPRIVPEAALKFKARVNEIENSTDIEVTVYEPQKGPDHLEGTFWVGVLVEDEPAEVPEGMDYLYIEKIYAVNRGLGLDIGKLYVDLEQWILGQEFIPETLDQYIIEMYFPLENGTEEFEIYIPIKESSI